MKETIEKENLKLHYFNGRGRAEIIRMILAVAEVSFEDIRYPMENWENIKKTMPTEKVPVLDIDGKLYPQSLSIARYLANKFGLVGGDALSSFKCDIIVDTALDLANNYIDIRFLTKETEKEAKLNIFKNKTAPGLLNSLEKLVKEYGNDGWCVGNSMTWADLFVYYVCQEGVAYLIGSEFFSNYPALERVKNNLLSTKIFSEYIKNRPETPF